VEKLQHTTTTTIINTILNTTIILNITIYINTTIIAIIIIIITTTIIIITITKFILIATIFITIHLWPRSEKPEPVVYWLFSRSR